MNIYEHKHYKLLLLIPIALLIVMLYYSQFVRLGIEFQGGTLITLPVTKPVDALALQNTLDSKFSLTNLDVRTTSGATNGLFIEFTGEKSLLQAQQALEIKDYKQVIDISKKFTGELNLPNTTALADQADAYFSKARESFKNSFVASVSDATSTPVSSFSVRDIGPSLGSYFLSQSETALIVAFVLIALLVFYYFRTPVVSFAVVQSALYDAILGYAALGFFGIPLSLATIAPLLMLIGYSVDTDIMLTDRILKRREGTPVERASGAFITGMMMTWTGIVALSVLFIVASYANIETLKNISLILVIGLFGDIIATWCTNAVLVLWHLERKEKKVV